MGQAIANAIGVILMIIIVGLNIVFGILSTVGTIAIGYFVVSAVFHWIF
jgi:hypothetical protein